MPHFHLRLRVTGTAMAAAARREIMARENFILRANLGIGSVFNDKIWFRGQLKKGFSSENEIQGDE